MWPAVLASDRRRPWVGGRLARRVEVPLEGDVPIAVVFVADACVTAASHDRFALRVEKALPLDVIVTVVRNLHDRVTFATLERADVSRLAANGWKAPQPITVKARDEQTDLYGLMYRPTDFDA